MEIIKKDGRIEIFNKKKLSTSIENSARDNETYLNESDLNFLVGYIENMVKNLRKDNSNTSSYEIKGLVSEALIDNGFKDILNKYLGLNN
ncbi:ATP cone domain-containing protein [Clostridium intestinale]|uniref:ATP cone domain-containing protein n=1 Tax=Clostridium intestinale DSM 6191 TaxID=1121320 RepID=A0A1M5ZV79_9CLOT|nr:ATP cone domain-containing protein [Clostridium intestinale]SHI28140.1 ATP cone domain-containing protein [Clostridium intestinale DSM 6191]